jgi:hypothetical protein
VTPDQIIESLAQLTAGWTVGPTQKTGSLDVARRALAASLAFGRDIAEIHPGASGLPAAPVTQGLTESLGHLIAGAPELANPTVFGVVRSAAELDPNNPGGLPAWARGMVVQESLGPFLDASGIAHFVDILPITREAGVAFGTASGVFGVFPVEFGIVEPNTDLALGKGSVWFDAHLLVASLPANSYTGFLISSGLLKASAPFQVQGSVFVLPANATITLTATLDPPAVPAGGSNIGKDAEADVVHLPKTVTIGFIQTKAGIEALDPSSGTVYGTSFSYTRNASPPIAFNNNTAILVPCTSSIASYSFASVASTEFTPSGTAAVVGAGWVLPVAVSTGGALGQAAGAGSLLVGLGTGASLKWQLHPAVVPIMGWQIFLDPTQIVVIAGGVGTGAVLTTYKLWPERAPSKRNSSIDFFTPAGFLVTFVSTSGTETLTSLGEAIAHLDRPLAADGMRYGLAAPASIGITIKSTGTQVTIFASEAQPGTDIHPLALENVLIGVELPYGFLLSGPVSGTLFTQCGIAVFFNAQWLLPTLPDPYASTYNFQPGNQSAGVLTSITTWTGGSNVALSFVLGPAAQTPAAASAGGVLSRTSSSPPSDLFASAGGETLRATTGGFTALLDLSTNVDLFGVAIVPPPGGTVGNPAGAQDSSPTQSPATAAATPAPAFGFTGLTLAFNGGTCATFALPQVSWEPMESTANPSGPIYCNPPSDGPPLLLIAPDQQQLVPLAPGPVLLNNITNVVAGQSFFAEFSLPFGLVAHIQQPNQPPAPSAPPGSPSLFLSEGGEFQLNTPIFPSALQGALQLTLKPPFPQNSNATFSGNTSVDFSGGTPRLSGYGFDVLSSSGATIFQNEFDNGPAQQAVPLRRIDLAGYGASIFSEWADNTTAGPHVTKVDFKTVIGRTAFEVVQVATNLYHYGVSLVRTITMQRQGAGWVQRTDTGWVATSNGLFTFPNVADFAGRVHRGAVAGVFNVRNIREVENYIFVPPGNPPPSNAFEFKQVLFDADIGLDHRVAVLQGGTASTQTDADGNPVTLVPARDLVGYVQLGPVGSLPDANALEGLFQQTGTISAAFSCVAQIGSLGATAGTTLRCAAIEGNMATISTGPSPVPALGEALRSAPVLPHDGAWGFGQRKPTDPGPSPLAHDFPVPIVQPTTDPNNWHIADITDVLRLDNPANLYGILQDTGTQKLLFEQPTIPLLSAASPPGSVPGIQLPNPPNFADVASLLNSTGLFPDIANTIALLGGAADQLKNAGDGLKYSKTVTFDPNKPALTLLDLGVLQVALSYCDESKGRTGTAANAPTALKYTLDPTAAKRWSFEIDNLSFLVYVPAFSSSDALLTIIGGMVADEQTKPTLSNLNLVYGAALDSLKSIFSKLQALAQFLPGGVGAGLNVALADGKLTVTDTFALPTLPLGLGELSDIGIDIGLALTLSPLSADFIIGVGNPETPFNWIVSPLAGNGLIDVGVKGGQPELTVQGGIGLGLAIDVAIASGSASITIAVQLDITGSTITVIFILNGQASVDVLGGLASASISLTASVGVSVSPLPIPHFLPPPVDFPAEDITFLASVSVGIHISICWVVNVDFDGSWQFSQSIHTPEIQIAA